MDISTFDREQLKDIIRENDWDDKPNLNSSEKDLEAYLQGKIDSGELKFGVIETSGGEEEAGGLNTEGDEPTGDNARDAIAAAAALAEEEAETEEKASPVEGASEFEGETEERIVEVSILKKVFVQPSIATFPEFDEDGIPTVRAKVPLSWAKAWSKNGLVAILG